jgi:class 3 adenylate cyclase
VAHLVEHIETALEGSGIQSGAEPPGAVAFLDVEGYTRFTEERGDEEAARLADTLASVVERRTRGRRGQAVKWLGDGAMSYFRDPADAVVASLEMVADARRAGLPPAHVGVAAGPVVVQAGDYFGRTVNMAARLSTAARGGQVLVNEVLAQIPCPGVGFRDLGSVDLKGVRGPTRVFEAWA